MIVLLLSAALASIIEVLGGYHHRSAVAAVATACGSMQTSDDLRSALNARRRDRDWENASAVFWWASECRPALLQPTHVNIVLSAFADARPSEWERALALLEQMPSIGLLPDAYSYSAAIAACSRAGQPERALDVFRRCCADESAGPNGPVFNAMLLACQQAGPRWRSQLLAVFAAMSAHGVQPSSWAYSSAIDAFSRLGRWERALELLGELERPESQVRPDSHCYSAAMRACLRAGSWCSVLELYDRMLAAEVPPTLQYPDPKPHPTPTPSP